MRTVNEIIDGLETISLDHHFIRSFKQGEMSEVDIQKLAGDKYPICYADISAATIDRGILTYSLDVIVMDMILPGQTDAQEQYSDTLADAYRYRQPIRSGLEQRERCGPRPTYRASRGLRTVHGKV